MKDLPGLIMMATIVGVGYMIFRNLTAGSMTGILGMQQLNAMTPLLPSGSLILNPSVSPSQGGYVPITIPGLPASGSIGGQVSSNCVSVGTGGVWCN